MEVFFLTMYSWLAAVHSAVLGSPAPLQPWSDQLCHLQANCVDPLRGLRYGLGCNRDFPSTASYNSIGIFSPHHLSSFLPFQTCCLS